jgi:hypothetical protein
MLMVWKWRTGVKVPSQAPGRKGRRFFDLLRALAAAEEHRAAARLEEQLMDDGGERWAKYDRLLNRAWYAKASLPVRSDINRPRRCSNTVTRGLPQRSAAMITVQLGGKKYPGMTALIDDSDGPAVAGNSWCPGHTGGPHGLLYPVSRIDGQYTRLHTFLTGWRRVDHEDGDPMNNQRYNLRKATEAQNAANMGKQARPTTSRFKGVSSDRRSGWRAYITVDGQRASLGGGYDSEEDAAVAYDLAAIGAFGEFARLNFPDQSPARYAAGERPRPLAPWKKLDDAQVIDIFRRCLAGEANVPLAAEFGVSRRTVGHIRTGDRWAHITRRLAVVS